MFCCLYSTNKNLLTLSWHWASTTVSCSAASFQNVFLSFSLSLIVTPLLFRLRLFSPRFRLFSVSVRAGLCARFSFGSVSLLAYSFIPLHSKTDRIHFGLFRSIRLCSFHLFRCSGTLLHSLSDSEFYLLNHLLLFGCLNPDTSMCACVRACIHSAHYHSIHFTFRSHCRH